MKKFIVFFLLALPLFAQEKIIYLTIPKSGTHLLRKAIELIVKHETAWIPLSETPYFNARLFLIESVPIVGGHLFPEMDKIRTKYGDRYKKILMIRDPRDVIVSFMHHLDNRLIWSGCPKFDFDSFSLLSFDEKIRQTILFPYEYRNPACTFAYASLWMKDPSVLVIRFEDLVGEQGGGTKEKQLQVMKSLASFLQVDLTTEELISLSNQLYGGTWTFREGQIGKWREHYSPENKQLFKELMGKWVIEFGYAVDNNW